jgi:hypothetical protein
MAAKQGPNVPFCMPNRTKCILLASVMSAKLHFKRRRWVATSLGRIEDDLTKVQSDLSAKTTLLSTL